MLTPVILNAAILPAKISLTEDEEVVVLATPMVNMYFNIVTIVNFTCNLVIIVILAIMFKDKGWLYQSIVAIFQTLQKKCLLSKLWTYSLTKPFPPQLMHWHPFLSVLNWQLLQESYFC